MAGGGGVVYCSKSELDLFSEPPLQTSVLSTTEVAYKPLNALGDDPSVIEFACLGHGDTYRDLSSIYLRLQVRLMKARPDTKHTDDSSSVVNNIMHSLFRQVNVYLNGVPISQSNMDYGYRAYFENLLNYGQDATSTHLDSVGWALDNGEMDAIEKSGDNGGLNQRKSRFKNSHPIELYGRIHADMFNQHRLLLNNVDLRVTLSIENPAFYVQEKADGSSYIKFESITMYMNHVQINPDVLLANEMKLSQTPASYPYKRVEVKAYTVPSGGLSLSLDNVVIGQLPNLILFAMVDNDAYTGTRALNPFNLKHNEITEYHLLINGVQTPNEPYAFDFSTADQPATSTRGYQSLFKDTGIHYFDRGHQISKKFFDKGCFILATDLTADRSTESGACGNLLNQGTVRIEARFKKALAKAVTVLIYAEYDSIIKIDKNRNVYTRF